MELRQFTWCHIFMSMIGGVGCVIQGGSVMESYQFEILDQYFSVIVTIPHISIKSQSLCIPTYFSVYLKPREVIIMHKIHKYLKTFLSSRWRHPSSWVTRSWPVPSLIFEFDIEVGEMGLEFWPGPVMAPVTAPQLIHILTATLTFNLISINYLIMIASLNVVEGFNMNWDKNSLNNFICHLS